MLWNQIPVTLGNIVGGFFFTGFALYFTYQPAAEPARAKASPYRLEESTLLAA